MPDRIWRDPFAIFKRGYSGLSQEEIKADLDARYDTGNPYPNPALWVHEHHTTLENIITQFLEGKTAGKRILEVGCGSGGVAAHRIRDAQLIVGVDLSDSALSIARDFFKERPEIIYEQGSAQELRWQDGSFDIAIAKEVLEHLMDAQRAIDEVYRVLNPGGLFALSSPNRDSLHLRVNRKLGRPDFKSAGDHIKEFTYPEMCNMLTQSGFEITRSEGTTLMPYHFEGVADQIRAAEECDPEFNEWLQVLGRRAGPEFAYCYAILARKPE